MAYKTPGVYIKEKSIFPPSVAQVETAIPAFIGYTEKAVDRSPNDLLNKPKRISSLLDFRTHFGGAPSLNISEVNLDGNNKLTGASNNPNFYLFYSMQLFFMNGGGDCYVISVGSYLDTISFGDRSDAVGSPGFDVGMAALEKEDEPTMIVFPDAVLLGENDFYNLQKNALAQCGDLMDRVAILDLRSDDVDTLGANFRDKIGTNQLKYGAAYSPYLKTGFIDEVRYSDFTGNLKRDGNNIELQKLTTESTIRMHIGRLDDAINDVAYIKNDVANIGNIRELFKDLYDTQSDTDSSSNYKDIIRFIYKTIVLGDEWFFKASGNHTSDSSKDGGVGDPYKSYQSEAENGNFSNFKAIVSKLIAFDKEADASFGSFELYLDYESGSSATTKIVSNANYPDTEIDWDDTGANKPDASSGNLTASTAADKRKESMPLLFGIFEELMESIDALKALGDSRQKSIDDGLQEMFPSYKNLLADMRQTLSSIPPSGAIAGIYARVDGNRGVWKAPANVSLNGVADLSYKFTRSDTDRLNVDTNFGKSINAIQFMTGMGFMVWGARTLAGNDNEWRYISVRRFFNMVEESCKKSTMWAVFEPNDANTWVKVKGMIDNFLTLQWRNGALQGAKPEDAFFVKIGLGETMTPIDILEGRMNIEIGMAVVRPAEFIILTFMHKMVES